MTQEGFKRKLTAILSADVIGYSRLMRDDEEATVRDLAAHRVLITEIIQQHNGRVVDSPGDNILAEFVSVVDAVNGAVKIQAEIKKSNAGVPEDRRMEFRIGVNLGDVIEEEERIYGDGVNIAARVEGLAAGGGIAISGTVYEHIKEKLSLGYHYLGEQDVKNISEPVRVYRLLTDPADAGKLIGQKQPKSKKLLWAASGALVIIIVVVGAFAIWNYYFRPTFEPASVENMAHPLPEKPSIAVLPFDNLSGDPNQDYFGDGLSEEIITALSNIPKLFVIARNSSFTYKGKAVKMQQIAEELGVQYVLEGSFRKSGDKIRITAQLIDATKGHHIWAERYDRELKDIFALQDDITENILTAMEVKLTEGEQARLWRKATENPKADEKAKLALHYFRKFNPDDNVKARALWTEAIELDPEYALAYLSIGWTHLIEVWDGYSKSPQQSLELAVQFAEKALELDNSLAEAHAFMGSIYLIRREYDKAVEWGERAVALSPNGADVIVLLALTLNEVGRPEEAITLFEKAIRLNPIPPIHYNTGLGFSYFMVGNYDDAIETFNRARNIYADYLSANLGITAALSMLGRENEAKKSAKNVLKLKPDFSLEWLSNRQLYKNQANKDRYIEALRKAGIPEHPPRKLPDKPSIAVLPFRNLSGDPEQEFLSDGFTEDIITTLAQLPRMFVIAPESSFTYKGKSVKIQEVGHDLGVRYILKGSIQKSGNRIRITAQLIDAQNGHHIWAEKFDREEQEIFKLRDDVIKEIAVALEIKLTEGAWLPGWGGITKNFDAYVKVRQSLEHFRRFTPDENILSRQKAREALELDPDYSGAMQMVAWTLLMDGMYGTSKTPEKSIEQAYELAQKALDKGDDLAGAHYLLGYAYIQKGQFEKGVSEVKIARELFPNSAEINAGLGMMLVDADRPMEAIAPLKRAMKLNPIPPSWYFMNLGGAYLNTEQYEKASLEYNKALQRQPDNMFAHLNLVVCYVKLNRQEDAHAEAEEVLRIDPEFSIQRYVKNFRFADEAVKQRRIDAMRKAGLPE